jgi:UDP-N-acetylglucosamine 2-epimerase (non-hydrolysing)
MKIISVVGARPNFMKIAPFINAIHEVNTNPSPHLGGDAGVRPVRGKAEGVKSTEEYNKSIDTQNVPSQTLPPRGSRRGLLHLLVHTGQHYDDRMSRAFFESLGIPEADINLGIGSGTHAEQVGNTMIAFEKVCLEEKPDWVVVVGDVNATLACSVTAKKLNIKVCHIEAGLRSGDMTMPEEINRLVTDRLSDLLLVPDKLSAENLRKEGVPEHKIKFVGNIMIDTLESNRETASKLKISDIIKNNFLDSSLPPSGELKGASFAVLTMHRPSNVDSRSILEPILNFLTGEVATDMPVIWPIHPRTQARLKEFGLWEQATACKNLILLHPIGYHEMLRLNMGARIMLTDSGGLQEECCVLGTPCLTLRWNTERPVTLREHGGASVLVGNNVERIRNEYKHTMAMERKPSRPELWDGQTALRCVEAIVNAEVHS